MHTHTLLLTSHTGVGLRAARWRRSHGSRPRAVSGTCCARQGVQYRCSRRPIFYSGHRASVRRRSQRRIDQLNRLQSRPSFLMAPLRQHAHSVLGDQMLRVRSTSARRSMLQRTRSARPASVPSTMACHQKRRLRCRCGSLMAAAGPAATTAARDHPHRLRLAPRDLFLGR